MLILHIISQLFCFLIFKEKFEQRHFLSSVQIGRIHETDAVRSAVAELTVTDKHSRLQLTEVTDEIFQFISFFQQSWARWAVVLFMLKNACIKMFD